MGRLLWRDAQGIEGALDLGATEVRVGRALDCAVRTDDAMVSRHHARVAWGGGGYVVEDLGSANGVWFQEQQVKTHLLRHGDAVRCGSLWLRFIDAAVENAPAPLMQHPGAGPAEDEGSSTLGATPFSFGALGDPLLDADGPRSHSPSTPPPAQGPPRNEEIELEVRVLRRRVEQLQTELRVYRGGKFGQETARKIEDVESDLSAAELERDSLKQKLAAAEDVMTREAGSLKVKRAIDIRALTSELVASLNDVLSSLRIEVMAAEGEFDQYATAVPRASYELIRQSLRDASGHIDGARELMRKLRESAA